MIITDKPHPEQKTVLIDTRSILPLPKELWTSNCAICDKPQASWLAIPKGGTPDDGKFTCSICFLHDSRWALDWADQIDRLIREVERERGQRYLRDSAGRLLAVRDANELLAQVLLTVRQIERIKDKSEQQKMMEVIGATPSSDVVAPMGRIFCEHHEAADQCECVCHTSGVTMLHDHACCSPCEACKFPVRCRCTRCDSEAKPS